METNALRVRRRRQREGRVREHLIGDERELAALHRQHGVGPGGDDRLVVDDLVAFELGDRH